MQHIDPSKATIQPKQPVVAGSFATIRLGYGPSTPLRVDILKAVAWCLGWWARREHENVSREVMR